MNKYPKLIMSNNHFIRNMPIFRLSFQFSNSQRNVPKIIIPSYNKSPVILAKQVFAKGKIQRSIPLPLVFVPGLLYALFINLNGLWTWQTITIQTLLITTALFYERLDKIQKMRNIQAIEASKDLKKFYFTVISTGFGSNLYNNNNIKSLNLKDVIQLSTPDDIAELQGLYIPIKTSKSYLQQNNKERLLFKKYLLEMQHYYLRLQIPKQWIKNVRYQPLPKQQQQLKQDRRNLSFEEFCKKYQNKLIQIQLDSSKYRNSDDSQGQNLSFCINVPKLGINSKYFDALIYGAQFDVQIQQRPQPGDPLNKKNQSQPKSQEKSDSKQ